MSVSPSPSPTAGLVLVLYDLDLEDQHVHVRQHEQLRLHSQTCKDWWLVSRQRMEDDSLLHTDNSLFAASSEPFYVPSSYLRILKHNDDSGHRKDDCFEKTSDEALGSSQDSLNAMNEHDYANLPPVDSTASSTSDCIAPQRMAPPPPQADANENKKDESQLEGIYAEPFPVTVAPRARKRTDSLPPLYANIDLCTSPSSKQPVESEQQESPSQTLVLSSYRLRRTLWDDWLEYEDREGQRQPLFYNQRTKAFRQKPPRRLTIGSGCVDRENSSPSPNELQMNSVSTQTTLPYSTPLERRAMTAKLHVSDDSDDEKMQKVKDIVRKWNESSFRRAPSVGGIGKRGSIPLGLRSNPLKGSRVTSRSSEDLLEVSSSNSRRMSPFSPPPLAAVTAVPRQPHSPLASISELLTDCPPESWQKRYDATTKETYFVNPNNSKWFCKQDENGKIYFYNRNTGGTQDNKSAEGKAPGHSGPSALDRSVKACSLATDTPSPPTSTPPRMIRGKNHEIIFSEQFKHSSPFQYLDHVFPHFPSKLETKDIIFDGYLNRTRTIINGSRQKRKNWSVSYVALTQYYLLFYKDRKQSTKESPKGGVDFVLGLWNAKIEMCPASKSSRKNCFQLSTFQDQVLLQDDQAEQSQKWFATISTCIANLPSLAMNIQPVNAILEEKHNHSCAPGGPVKLKRSRSTKQYRPAFEEHRHGGGSATLAGFGTTSSSMATINCAGGQDRKIKISERLINFFKKRPSIESLREKGIMRDEAVFGSTLERLAQRDRATIPKFVTTCIQAIEAKDLKADGIYRACGNLSTVQKLRFEANQEKYTGIWKEDDVHVLTGLLKMFFRDMKEPLFPSQCMPRLIETIAMKSAKDKLREMKKLIHELPEPNYQTLKFLLQHLLRVISHSAENRMHIQNLAIVFGPTLMRSANDLNNLTLEMMMQMQQSQIVDFLLQEFEKIFDK